MSDLFEVKKKGFILGEGRFKYDVRGKIGVFSVRKLMYTNIYNGMIRTPHYAGEFYFNDEFIHEFTGYGCIEELKDALLDLIILQSEQKGITEYL